MLKVFLNKGEEKEKILGYPWIFNNEVNRFDGNIINGDICMALTFEGKFLCYGFLNTSSKIMVRILSYKEDDVIDKEFFKKRIAFSIEHRKTLGFIGCTRLVFSEADYLPGLIVDQYGDYLSVQFMCLGMDKIKNDIVDILVELTGCKGIYERSDMPVREKEGLPQTKGYLYGRFDTRIEVVENGIKFIVDVAEGQKTGYFLDQKLNRDILKYYVGGKDVLDCFSNVGGFALHALKYGAKSVVATDISRKACDDILYNASLNNFKNLEVKCVDVFDFLRNDTNTYDVIVLDPPAFTKSKDTVKKAYKGYLEINTQALKKVRSGGYLLTFSCSQHMTPDLFFNLIEDAAHNAKRDVRLVDFRVQSPDHPSLLQSESELYLKCLILRVI